MRSFLWVAGRISKLFIVTLYFIENTMKTLSVNIPEEANEMEVKMTMAAILFDRGLLSAGQAAEFSGVSKKEFILNAGKYGVSIFGETPEDLNSGSINE
jgi:predicted HTH domain antitoxin